MQRVPTTAADALPSGQVLKSFFDVYDQGMTKDDLNALLPDVLPAARMGPSYKSAASCGRADHPGIAPN